MTLGLLDLPSWTAADGQRGEGYASWVSPSHRGPCAMGYVGLSGRQHWAVFPDHAQAEAAAHAACRWDIGGYSAVAIHPLATVALDTRRYETATDWLFGDVEPVPEADRPRGVFYVARIAMRDMVRKIADNPDELLAMEWVDLERALFEALLGLGYAVRRTRSTKDGGYDLSIDIEGQRFLVELKHWSAPSRVGPDAIERFAEVVMREEAAAGLFLSSSGYRGTVATRLRASRAPVRLGDREKMLSFCRNFVLSERGVWEREEGLLEVFFKDTL